MAIATTQRRWVDLEGAVNVRDLGGLPLARGGHTVGGRVLRADNLQGLTGRDVTRLVEQIGVRRVVDLRTGAEVELEGPGPLVGDERVEVRHRSLFPESGTSTDVDVDGLLPWQERGLEGNVGEQPAVRAYLGYLRDRPDSVVDALRDMADGDGAAIVHCAAGKDRTGVLCALALETAGVLREAVVADYLATAERLEAVLGRLRASSTYAADLDGRPAASHLPQAHTMTRVLEVLEHRHGGAHGWLDAHGFGAADQAALRARLTA